MLMLIFPVTFAGSGGIAGAPVCRVCRVCHYGSPKGEEWILARVNPQRTDGGHCAHTETTGEVGAGLVVTGTRPRLSGAVCVDDFLGRRIQGNAPTTYIA
jgi:hypothetical protein